MFVSTVNRWVLGTRVIIKLNITIYYVFQKEPNQSIQLTTKK